MTHTTTTPTPAGTSDRVGAAREIGYERGWDHANFCDAYGHPLDTDPDVPDRFAPVARDYTDAYEHGVLAFDTSTTTAAAPKGARDKPNSRGAC